MNTVKQTQAVQRVRHEMYDFTEPGAVATDSSTRPQQEPLLLELFAGR